MKCGKCGYEGKPYDSTINQRGDWFRKVKGLDICEKCYPEVTGKKWNDPIDQLHKLNQERKDQGT